ncbi:hypothetical protein J1N35_040453 [Gossypium stocksii]|uniref:Cupin type-1 domain-containing protein n=1 Tax=Gossypium stocksii TaxID=47602 RepID=A0A9D3ZHP8_9ROSI|nr:hypothetical protein J1N35_040453 [Gossypium stocksii]
MGLLVTVANVEKIPCPNTLCVIMSHIDYSPSGVNPSQAMEIVFVLEGELKHVEPYTNKKTCCPDKKCHRQEKLAIALDAYNQCE